MFLLHTHAHIHTDTHITPQFPHPPPPPPTHTHIAIAIKESAHVGDKAQKRMAKGVDDLGKRDSSVCTHGTLCRELGSVLCLGDIAKCM